MRARLPSVQHLSFALPSSFAVVFCQNTAYSYLDTDFRGVMACCFLGELVIIPIQGRDLPNRERFGKQDPFILFKLGNVSKRSSTDVRGGQRPRWNDEQVKKEKHIAIEHW